MSLCIRKITINRVSRINQKAASYEHQSIRESRLNFKYALWHGSTFVHLDSNTYINSIIMKYTLNFAVSLSFTIEYSFNAIEEKNRPILNKLNKSDWGKAKNDKFFKILNQNISLWNYSKLLYRFIKLPEDNNAQWYWMLLLNFFKVFFKGLLHISVTEPKILFQICEFKWQFLLFPILFTIIKFI